MSFHDLRRVFSLYCNKYYPRREEYVCVVKRTSDLETFFNVTFVLAGHES